MNLTVFTGQVFGVEGMASRSFFWRTISSTVDWVSVYPVRQVALCDAIGSNALFEKRFAFVATSFPLVRTLF